MSIHESFLRDTQPARVDNIDAIVALFESGAQENLEHVGIELEHSLIHSDTGKPVTYSEQNGVAWLLSRLNDEYPDASYDGDNDLIGVSRKVNGMTEAITIEPAAQVELSAGPFANLTLADACFENFEATLNTLLDSVGCETSLLGYNSSIPAAECELIPKKRYEFMNAYLGGLSPWGPRMMRGTTSTQISIDYADTADCLRKMRLANALVPLLALMTDNTPIFEGARRTHHMMRTEVWKYCDPDRCRLVPGVMNPAFSLEDYAAYILDTPAILVPDGNNDWRYEERTFGEIYADRVMTADEVLHAVSMEFNDVRLKTYLEIRPADAMPIPYVIAYAALIKGLFATEENLAAMEVLFAAVTTNEEVESAKDLLMDQGYKATVYGKNACNLCIELCALAARGLASDETNYLDPLKNLVESRLTLADLWLRDHRDR